MLDVSKQVIVNKDHFSLSSKLKPQTNVKFRAKWRNDKVWSFEGYIADDSVTIHLTCISSK